MMRMRELAARSELPRTTIQHYLRERLLPEPERTARNAAVYSEAHLERLLLIRRLRGPDGGRLPLAQVRRVIELVDRGVDVDLAIGLQEAILDGRFAPQRELLTLEELAARSGEDAQLLRDWLERGLLVPAWVDGEPFFDGADLEMIEHLATPAGVATAAELGRIAAKFAEISDLEMKIRNRAVEQLADDEALRLSLDLQNAANFIHRYLFARNRQRNVEALHGGIHGGEASS